jgi:hypothetical protein
VEGLVVIQTLRKVLIENGFRSVKLKTGKSVDSKLLMFVSKDKTQVTILYKNLKRAHREKSYGLTLIDFCKIALYHEIGHLADNTEYQSIELTLNSLMANGLASMKCEKRAHINGRKYVEQNLLAAYDELNEDNITRKLSIIAAIAEVIQLSEIEHQQLWSTIKEGYEEFLKVTIN